MSNPDDDVRRLLHDAVSVVQPHGSFDDIRSRTDKVVPMKRWFLPTIAVAAVMAAVVGGAFWLVNNDDTSGSPSGTPSHSTAPDTPGTSPSSDDVTTRRAVPVYWVGDTAHGTKLFREFQQEQVCGGDECLLKASVVTAMSGHPDDADYDAPWPSGTGLGDLTYEGGTLTIGLTGDVHDRPSGMSAADAQLAIQQLIYSAQAGLGQGRVPVQLLLDGKHTDTILGVPASEPLAAANADDVLSPVQIDSPAEGASVDGTFTVTGRASAFEANVQWELKQGETVVRHGFATAQECCTLSPYSFDVTAPSGDYTLVVHDEDMSGEGRPVNQDTKEITVQ
ncbi:MAG TPA: Gmad2 immunoglobulin-like domain-containing protein [Marmoricola sp.]|nr:Gmad2 immunoglobulin-like domain-containing protein [Marmoricola sp.]